MKKSFLSLFLIIVSFGLFAQEPTHTKKPKTFQPGNWYMVGNWDSTAAAYKDTVGYYLENDTIHIWSNKILHLKSTGEFKLSVSGALSAGINIGSEENTSFGLATLYSNTSGMQNTAFGHGTLQANTTGGANTAIGHLSLYTNTSGGMNTCVGVSSLNRNTHGDRNTAIGYVSLMNNTTGNKNTGTGYYSLYSNTTDSNNIAIGYMAGYTATMSNRLWIGQGDSNNAIIYGEMLTRPRIRINGSLNVSGQIKYNLIHGVASTDSIAYTVGGTQSVYYKLNPTGADTLKSHEEDGVSFPGDSAKVSMAGDYVVHCWLNLSTSGVNDKIRVKLYKNNAAFTLNSIGTWIINSDGTGENAETKYFMWHVTLAANDILSVRVANLTGNSEIVLRDWKLYIEKKPE